MVKVVRFLTQREVIFKESLGQEDFFKTLLPIKFSLSR